MTERVLGIDHATRFVGVASLDGAGFSFTKWIDLSTFPNVSPMLALHQLVRAYIRQFEPHVVATERPLALRNGKVARMLIEVYAAVLLAAELEGVDVVEVSPQLAKFYTAGHREAEKEDVARSLVAQYGLDFNEIAPPEFYKKDGKKGKKGEIKERHYDVSDACALCIAAREIKRMEAVT